MPIKTEKTIINHNQNQEILSLCRLLNDFMFDII